MAFRFAVLLFLLGISNPHEAGSQARADSAFAVDSARLLLRQAAEAFREGSADALKRAIGLQTRSLSLWRRARNRSGEGATLIVIGRSYNRLGRLDSALVFYGRAYENAREGGDRVFEALTLNNLGLVFGELGRLDSALVFSHRALEIRREVGNRQGEAATLNNLGHIYEDSGQHDSALVYSYQALVIARELGNRSLEAVVVNNLGEVYERLGQLDSALVYATRGLVIRREVGDRRGEGSSLGNLGVVYERLGRLDSAFFYLGQALVIVREVGDRSVEATTLSNLGAVYERVGRLDSALVYYARGLVIRREVGDQRGEGVTLNNLGSVYATLGRHDSALVYYTRALTIWLQLGDWLGRATTLDLIGRTLFTLGRPADALARFAAALTMMRQVGNTRGEMEVLGHLGQYYQRRGALRAAAAYFDSSAVVTASLGARAGGDPNRLSFAEQGTFLFEAWPLTWLARAPEVGTEAAALAALAAAERGRAQALLELMRRTRLDLKPGADLAAEGRRLVTLATAHGEAVLFYLQTKDTLVAWLALPDGSIEIVRRAVTRDSVAQLVASVRTALGADDAAVRGTIRLRGGSPLEPAHPADGPGRGQGVPRPRALAGFEAATHALADLILPSALEQKLGSVNELVIVPHGTLGLVPFAALPLAGGAGPVGSRYALHYAPSLSAFLESESRPRPDSLLPAVVVGNPQMPVRSGLGEEFALRPLSWAEEESRWVARELGTEALTGARATEAEVRRRLGAAVVIHLASHGFAYSTEARARQSFVALAPGEGQDGFLTVGELLDDSTLTLHADLIVLSACQTGLGDLKQAEGTVGLQRAFLAKGARSVLVSLWSVSDEATESLMRGFYRHWRADSNHPSKAEALRRAQEDVRAKWPQPRYWAAFQLVGAN